MKEKVVYSNGEFTDYSGKVHQYTVAAVSRPVEIVNGVSNLAVVNEDNKFVSDVTKVLSIGISICNPDDTYDEELGKKIAYEKAISEKNDLKLYAAQSGLVNTRMVEALIEQEKAYFEAYPEKHIKGYQKAMYHYYKVQMEQKIREEQINSLTGAEKDVLYYLHDLPKKKREMLFNLANEI